MAVTGGGHFDYIMLRGQFAVEMESEVTISAVNGSILDEPSWAVWSRLMSLAKLDRDLTEGLGFVSVQAARIDVVLRGVYSDTTQLYSTSSCRHVHSVNNCHLSMNVVTQLTQFVGRDVIKKNTTDLAVRCSTGSVELSCVAIDTRL